ncbi:MAG: N-acetylmuramoyl-L-alanine amidase [Pseudomonadota bacterium]
MTRKIPNLLVICFLFFFAQPVFVANAAEEGSLPIALGASVVGDDATTRFFIDFDKNLKLKTFYLDEPLRIIIDLEEATFDFSENQLPKPTGLISNIRFGRISQGRSRIVLSLTKPAEIIRAGMQKRLDREEYRFLLDFDSTDIETYSSLLNTQRRELGESGTKAKKGNRVTKAKQLEKDLTIVLDPGHGGIDGGATGRGGAQEKDIVLNFALILAEMLKNQGKFNVLMTRQEDVFVSLRQRLDFNRRHKADLFISIHADSLRQRYVRGATIYTLSKRASDKLSEELAQSENKVDLLAGIKIETDVEAVTDILADLTAQETKRFSRSFSRMLVDKLDDEIVLIKNPLRSAAFGVLKAPDVPGILLELGYLSNAEDEKLLQQEIWQTTVAEAITQSVNRFFENR